METPAMLVVGVVAADLGAARALFCIGLKSLKLQNEYFYDSA